MCVSLCFVLGTSARLLRLMTVLQKRRFWSGAELSSELDVTARTLRRDVDRLRSLGYTVEATSGPGGGYQLGRGTVLPPLELADDEAVAVAVALESAADTFAGLSDVAGRVRAKLDQLLPARLRRRVSALSAVTMSLLGDAATLNADVLTTIATACRDEERLELSYTDREKQVTRRTVEPLRLAHVGNRRWYFIAYDVGKHAWRTFRVDRISAIHSVGPRFVPREAPKDVTQYVSDSISHAPCPYRARLKLEGRAESLARRVPPWCGVLEPLDARSSVLSMGSGSIEGLVCLMVLVGIDFEILEPRSLAAEVRKVSQRLARASQQTQKKRK
jgi:predicted DNA-binding transcriptional regulator YafY